MLLRVARLTQPDFQAIAARSSRPQLLTIPYSSYCDLGAWSLRAAAIPYSEHTFGPGGNILPLVRLRLGGSERHLSKTSAVSKPSPAGDAEVHVQKRSGGSPTAVPACCLPDGSVLVDSWDIAAHASAKSGIAPVPDDLKHVLDTRLGPLNRQLSYHVLFAEKNQNVWNGVVTHDTSALWRGLWWAGGRQMTQKMVKMFSSDDGEQAALCRQRLNEVFDSIAAEHLSGGGGHGAGGPFVGGTTTPGMADVALASLAAPAVMPALYCEGRYAQWFDQLLAQDAPLSDEVDAWRESPVGRHCLATYEWRMRAFV